jgi:hypothetical protein
LVMKAGNDLKVFARDMQNLPSEAG